jgi:hypothetical protein
VAPPRWTAVYQDGECDTSLHGSIKRPARRDAEQVRDVVAGDFSHASITIEYACRRSADNLSRWPRDRKPDRQLAAEVH